MWSGGLAGIGILLTIAAEFLKFEMKAIDDWRDLGENEEFLSKASNQEIEGEKNKPAVVFWIKAVSVYHGDGKLTNEFKIRILNVLPYIKTNKINTKDSFYAKIASYLFFSFSLSGDRVPRQTHCWDNSLINNNNQNICWEDLLWDIV